MREPKENPARYREGLPPIPRRLRSLPVDRGYPVPWFCDSVDGHVDFRIMDGRKLVRAVRERVCWVCGQPLGRTLAFLIGPMCAVNRVSSEPPSHRDCAEFSAQACPFLSRPHERRRVDNLPTGDPEFTMDRTDGAAIPRNPGVALLWLTDSYTLVRAPNGAPRPAPSSNGRWPPRWRWCRPEKERNHHA